MKMVQRENGSGNTRNEEKARERQGACRTGKYTIFKMLIGFISFYRKWIPLYEDRIGRWKDSLKKLPGP